MCCVQLYRLAFKSNNQDLSDGFQISSAFAARAGKEDDGAASGLGGPGDYQDVGLTMLLW